MLRILTATLVLLLALVAWGCSSSDDTDQPAAAELLDSDFRMGSPNFSEVRPKVRIPKKNTCHGENQSPPLDWSGAPDGTNSFALIAENMDYGLKADFYGRAAASETGIWVHWVLYNIPSSVSELAEAISTSTTVLPDGTTQGTNDDELQGYYGPCPPLQFRNLLAYDFGVVQRYNFSLYALDSELELAAGATKDELEKAMEGHILARADALGKYSPPFGLQEKGGAFLKTSAQEGDNLTQTPDETPDASAEKIYNRWGDLITPTPAP